MKDRTGLPVFIIPIATLSIGLLIGLGVGHIQTKKEQKFFQDKLKEADRKVVFLEKKMEEQRNETAVSMQQAYQSDSDKVVKLENDRKILTGQLAKLREQTQNLEMKVKESDEVAARAKKLEARVKELDEASTRAKKELQEMGRNNKDLDHQLKKITGEKQTLQAELKKKTQDLGQCASHNAELCIIAEELVKKYRNKGLGAVFLEKEPLTQIKKVELEQFAQKYEEEIRQQQIDKNNARWKDVSK